MTDQAAAPPPVPAAPALAFPGQGVDPVDLAAVLAEHAGDPLVERLAQVVGTSDWDGLDLLDTRVAQPAVFVASLLSAQRDGPGPAGCAAVLGHSLGEVTAFAFAGTFPATAALDLVVRRAELGHELDQRRPGRMVVAMRLDEAAVEWVRRGVVADGHGVLEVAVVNGPGQVVLSGDEAAARQAVDRITDAGGVGRLLTIGGAYHSPLLAPAVEPLRSAVAAVAAADPVAPVISCTTGRPVRRADEVAEVLARALVLPVRWPAAVAGAADAGARTVVDAGPGRTLANLARFSPVLPAVGLRPEP